MTSKKLDHGGTLKDYTPLSSVEVDTKIDSVVDTNTHEELDTVKRSIDTKITPELFVEMVHFLATAMQPKSPLWWQGELEHASCSGLLLTTGLANYCLSPSSMSLLPTLI